VLSLVDDLINISIIVPLYNGEKYIEKIISIIKNNTLFLPNVGSVELLFINDVPKRIDIDMGIFELPQNLIVKFLQNEKNLGIHKSRVRGVQQSRGDYILFLDQDDLIYDNYLLSQLGLIEDADVIICNGINNHKVIYTDKRKQEFVLNLDDWLLGINNIISPGQALIRKSAIPIAWLENTIKINGADDLLLWVILHSQNAKFKINKNILYEHIWHATNASSNISRMRRSLEEIGGIAERIGIETKGQEVISCILNNQNMALTNFSMNISVFKQWLYYSEKGITMEKLLCDKNYMNIAIYGMGDLGECLLESLSESLCINILYGIDRRAKYFKFNFPVYFPEEDIPESDVIIVTVLNDFKEIEYNLRQKSKCKIISIVDLFE
jgi:glycosyltransferase involved in cell wall biosynthesis